jgi:energy-coupling factor transporter ATP-binding protein EcfA2
VNGPGRFALVVGIDAYTNGIPELGSARNDAAAIAEALATQHGYQVTSLLDGEATRDAMTSFLTKEIPAKLDPETPFLVYFAGHGVAEGDDGSNGPQGYLIPQDAVLGQPDTWLSMDVFRAALNALDCRHLLVVLDCCYAGAFRWATATRDISLVGTQPLYESLYQRYMDGEAWQALTSASAAQQAADVGTGLPNLRGIDADGHSPFAAALLQGLAGAADSSIGTFPPDGVITATELYQYISTCLLPAPDAPTTQTPGIWPLRPDSIGEFVFLNPEVPLKVAPDPVLDETTNPWLGLEAYTADTKDLYFGRGDVTAALVARARKRRSSGSLIAVVGPSGAGKTSLVQAGLVPALTASKSSAWVVVEAARLAGDPNGAFAAAITELQKAPKRHRRIVVFDQFEELYTQCGNEDRGRFLASLRELIVGKGGPVVVVTIRSDFELRAADDEALKGLWQAARFQVPPLSGDELRQVIVGPAQVKAVFFEPAKLADDIYDEVSQTPGALPLLSFALAELYRTAWARPELKTDRSLTAADYKKLGGVVGALNGKATQLFDSATPDQQQAIRRVFLRLVSQEGAGLTGRQVERAELQFGNGDDAEQQTVDGVINLYAGAGLLVLDGDTVEPASDALVAQWQELHDWLKASESQDLIRAAWTAASKWAAERDKRKAQGYLWDRDPRLPQLRAANLAGDLNATERAFESASTKLRTARRRRVVTTTAAVMALLALAALVAWVQRDQAIANQKSARSQALVALAQAQPPGSLDASLLLNLAGYETKQTLAAGAR